jgi:hypothetical protein
MAQFFWDPSVQWGFLPLFTSIKLLFLLPLIVQACHSLLDPGEGLNKLNSGITVYKIMLSANDDSLTPLFPIYMPFISFFCLLPPDRTYSTMLNKSS